MKKALCLFGLFIVASSYTFNANSNWAHWRGPHMNGSNPDATPPTKWDENTNIKWKVDLPGLGSSTPIVWENKIFVTTAVQTDRKKETTEAPPQQEGRRGRFGGGSPPSNFYQFKVMCYDINSGDEIWSKVAIEQVPHEGHHQTGTFASGSPTTDGEHLYVTFGSRGVFCFDLDGNPVWDRDFGDMRTRNSFGEGTSLTVHGDSLIVNWDHEEQSFIEVVNKNTGDTIWKKDRDERTTWATPVVFEYEGVEQLIVNGTTKVRSYNLKNGELIWECGGQTGNPIPTPIRYKDTVICTSGFRGEAMYAIPLSAKGDISNSETIVWTFNKNTPYVPTPVLYDGQLYFVKSNDAILTSVKAEDGSEVIESERLSIRGGVYSSIGAANDHIYIVSREGDTAVLKHGDDLEIVAENRLNQPIDASPVFIGNKLLLRGANTLFCIAEG